MDPKALRYTETHEWARLEGDLCIVGVTQFAADQLTDITYIEFCDVGTEVAAGKDFGKIETVKAVSDLYAPVSGEVVEVNKKVLEDNDLFKDDPYGKGWFVKIRVAPGTTLDHLMTLEQYQQQIASAGH
jgi:glycine cleavage system H protein